MSEQWKNKMQYACWFAARYDVRVRVYGVRAEHGWMYRLKVIYKGAES